MLQSSHVERSHEPSTTIATANEAHAATGPATQLNEANRHDTSASRSESGATKERHVYRDPDDIITIRNLTFAALVLVALLLTSTGGNIWMYYRRPDRIVVDKSSGRVIEMDNRSYGETEAVQLGPEKLIRADKEYVTAEFIKNLYGIDPATRPRDIERALKMVVPRSALILARYLKQKGILEKQHAESWQAKLTVQDIAVDGTDPYTVRVIGKQEIMKMVAGVAEQETKQLKLTVKLMADPDGRADRNLRSGFLVAAIDYKELGGPNEETAANTSPVQQRMP